MAGLPWHRVFPDPGAVTHTTGLRLTPPPMTPWGGGGTLLCVDITPPTLHVRRSPRRHVGMLGFPHLLTTEETGLPASRGILPTVGVPPPLRATRRDGGGRPFGGVHRGGLPGGPGT